MEDRRVLGIDLETFSAADIKSVGSFKYIDDPTFEIMLFAYAWDDGPVEVIDLMNGEDIPDDVYEALTDPTVTKTAWNCAFERECLRKYTGQEMPPEQWQDSMILAAVCGLPMSLGGAGKALGLPEDSAKDKAGKQLIRYFCSPCRPTKANGGRTRNLPEHDPEKWAQFIEYNRQDVVAERTIRNMLKRWTPDETEHKFWCLDADINGRGMRVDLPMVRHAIQFDNKFKADLTEQAIALTGMENPNSISQIKQWLLDQEGIEVPSLNKKVVADVVSKLSTDRAREFMAMRKKLAKSSTKKYEAMERAACSDEHIKGMFQFYGATRTGRFAGRICQLQNLPQNHMPDLDTARELVREGDYDTFLDWYGDVSGTLSELVRTALVPEPGHKLIVADFSAIEARVLAWLAGEQWVLDAFQAGRDIYCETASMMFGVPVVKHGENGELRQKGKIATLACIAENELVLTDKGLVPIQRVTTDMKLWDGENWVKHDGVVCRGIKEVIEFDGLKATADHLVWVEGEPGPIHFGVAAARRAHLLRTGDCGTSVRLGRDHLAREEKTKGGSRLLRSDSLRWLWLCAMDLSWKPHKRREQRLPKLLAETDPAKVVGQTTDSGEATMHKPKRPTIQKLWGSWSSVLFRQCDRGRALDHRESRAPGPEHGARPDRHQWRLRGWQSTLGNTRRELLEQTKRGLERVGPTVLAVCSERRHQKALGWLLPGRGHRTGRARRGAEAKELARHCGPARVYDIRNAGPNHRFTVSGVLVHNCGYGGGVNGLKAFGAGKMMTEEEMVQTLDLWRKANPRIVQMWKTMEKAMIRCIVKRTPTKDPISGIRFDLEKGTLWMTLPSGRRIAYPEARYEESQWRNGKTISYMGVHQQTKKWCRIETYGARAVENATQATARDCLRGAMMALDAAGFVIRAHVHDEVIISEPINGRSVEEVCKIMSAPLPWAPGLPLRADGYSCSSYRKD